MYYLILYITDPRTMPSNHLNETWLKQYKLALTHKDGTSMIKDPFTHTVPYKEFAYFLVHSLTITSTSHRLLYSL